MGATNHTPNYNLPQFLGTDKPAWLTDINGAFSDIDTAIKNAADDASSAVSTAGSASSAAAGAVNSVNTLDGQINTPGTGLAAQVSTLNTNVTNITNTIGSTPLTTVAQTLTGAIEEVKNSVPATSGIMRLITKGSVSDTFNGAKTIAQAMSTVFTAINNVIASLQPNEYIRIVSGSGSTYDLFTPVAPQNHDLLNSALTELVFVATNISSSQLIVSYARFAASPVARACWGTFTPTERTNDTPPSGSCVINYEKYKIEP